ncbi:MAG: hypothetical protein Mars2KO_14070 [Maribacter sp.]
MKYLVFLFIGTYLVSAQNDLHLDENTYQVATLNETVFTSLMEKQILESQFIFVGEQHGIKEVGEIANALFDLAYPKGYTTLCIETDALLAQKLKQIASSEEPLQAAEKLSNAFPFAIPFYNTKNDYTLFKNVIDKGGELWGIDQTFMAQFRLNFDHLIQTTENTAFKEKLIPLKQRAMAAYKESIDTKNFDKMFWQTYDEATHQELLALSDNPEEKEILTQLWKTKEIYGYNNDKRYYLNNQVRGQLMKDNFNSYYKKELKQVEIPKVIFKLGATHATRGLSMTNIYDISNYAAELAHFNNKKSLHFMVAGITGNAMVGNPFAENPIAPFDNTEQLPKELQELVPTFTKKYTLVHLQPLREYAYGKKYSEALKKFIFNFDFLVLVKDAQALTPF